MGKLERLLIMSVVALCLPHLSVADTDLPPVGHSAFDQLIGAGPVAYPFARLLSQLNAQIEADPGGLPPLKVTLIPLGRSLQRAAAAPDFFHFPRVIVAVDSPSKPGFAPLQDRLFIGYQEKSAVLEVISYNEAAGRFEFQIVRNYKAGDTPSVHYARRSLCLSCHQNAAPIFARPLWDETPANPAIAAKLRETGRDFYGVKLSGTDIAYFIDAATERANLFPVWQQIWREGCGAAEAGARCRRAWFDASLRYTLAGVMPPIESARFAHLQSRWAQLWPRGLPIQNPDIPNRDPLAAQLAENAPLGHVPAAFEPLTPRSPLEYWKSTQPQRLIAGLASLLNSADVSALDEALGRIKNPPTVQLTLRCRLAPKNARRIRFECGDAQNMFKGIWNTQTGARASGEVTALRIGDDFSATDIRIQADPSAPAHLNFRFTRAQRHARLSDGRRLGTARFTLKPGNASVTLNVHDDYAAVRNAGLTTLAANPGAFDSSQWLVSLMQTLAPTAPPLRRTTLLPPKQTEGASLANSSNSTNPLTRYCAQCHHTPDAFPPNFLSGDTAQRERQLDHCAERIYYRLRMWRTAETQRGKTPMPPPATLAERGLQPHTWHRSAELAALTDDAAARLRRQRVSPNKLLTQPYEQLRSCLPSTVQ